MHNRPTVELFRMLFTHHVETSCDRRVDADREIVINDVTRYRVSFFVPVIVPVVGVVVVAFSRHWIAIASVSVAVGHGHRRRRGWRRGRSRWRRCAKLDVPTIHHDHRAASNAVDDLTELFTLVTCHSVTDPDNRHTSGLCPLYRHHRHHQYLFAQSIIVIMHNINTVNILDRTVRQHEWLNNNNNCP